MISVAGVGGAGAASSYYTKDNYYSAEDLEQNSQWYGVGADAQGLTGPVALDAFTAVLEGRLPDGTVLANGQTGSHRPGMDLTFSAPKSLSLLAYVGGDTRLLEANMAAVKATLAWAEKNLAEARLGAGGEKVVGTGNLLVALFQHDTSRNLDPQAHIHAVVANATKTPEGKWQALHNDKLWSQNTLLGSIYHSYLREAVVKLGYSIGNIGKHGSFEIAGVSRETVEVYSTRRADILKVAEQVLDHQSPAGLEQVALRTRPNKEAVADRGELLQGWRNRATAAGIDLAPVVDAARMSAATGREPPSAWRQIVGGVRLVSDRATRVVDWLRDRLGVEPHDVPGELLPHGIARATPPEVAAAHAVASALRHLSEREAGFKTADVVKSALDLGLPVTVDDVERTLRTLVREEKLIAGKGDQANMLTTPQAIGFERALLAAMTRDHGKGSAIIGDRDAAGARIQVAATARSDLALNPGQEAAGRLILSATDRIISVQGIAGAGKSTALGAIADVARTEGRKVIALVPTHQLVADLGRASGIDTMTTAKFIGTHQRLLNDNADPQRIAVSQAMFKGSIVVVDEASMLGTGQATKLAELAHLLQFDRLALVGDKRQLPAMDAGKPFIQGQDVTQTAELTENLRGRHSLLRRAAEHVNNDRPAAALNVLKPWTRDGAQEAPKFATHDGRRAWLVDTAAAEYLALSPDERTRTLLISSSRAIGTDLNTSVQDGLIAEGRVSKAGLQLKVFDTLNLTREQERYVSNYQPGSLVEIGRDIKDQNIAKGTATVIGTDATGKLVRLQRPDGTIDKLDPTRLSERRTSNSFRIGTLKDISVHEHDRIRWTSSDLPRGLRNAATAEIVGIAADGITVRNSDGIEVTLPKGDRMLTNLDLGYALNTHKVQGATEDRAIAVMDSSESSLTSAKLFLVNTTRARDALTLVVDDRRKIADRLTHNSGDKTSALEIIGEVAAAIRALPPRIPVVVATHAPAPRSVPTPEPQRPPERALDRVPAVQPDFGL